MNHHWPNSAFDRWLVLVDLPRLDVCEENRQAIQNEIPSGMQILHSLKNLLGNFSWA